MKILRTYKNIKYKDVTGNVMIQNLKIKLELDIIRKHVDRLDHAHRSDRKTEKTKVRKHNDWKHEDMKMSRLAT